jgi:type IV pilus assembly protein PilA
MTAGMKLQGPPVATRGAFVVPRLQQGSSEPRRSSAIKPAELAVVLATTCLMMAVALTAYRTHQVRREVAEGIAVASELIPNVTEFFHRHRDVPAGLDALQPRPAVRKSSVVEFVEVADGRIDIVYGTRADPAIAGRRLSLAPYETVPGSIVWLCGNQPPGVGLQPLGFAGGSRRAEQRPTTVDARYLSPDCR